MFFTRLTTETIVDATSYQLPPRALGGVSQQRSFLHQSDNLAAAVYRFEVVPDGFVFSVQTQWRNLDSNRSPLAFRPREPRSQDFVADEGDFSHLSQETMDDVFRIGLEFNDGTRSEYLVEEGRTGPQIYFYGSSSRTATNDGTCSASFWVPRLPSPGPLEVYGAWPSAGLEECSTTFDADELIAKANEAIPLLSEV